MKHTVLCLLLALAATAASCSDDDAPLAAYRQDLVDLLTDANGQPAYLVQASGDTLRVASAVQSAQTLAADTTLRFLALYLQSGTEADVRALQQVVCKKPVAAPETERKCDPIDVAALWRSGSYVNFLLSFKTSGAAHSLAFLFDGLRSNFAGGKTLCLSLQHDANDDVANYTAQAYASCIVGDFNLSAPTDSIEVRYFGSDGAQAKRIAF